MVMKEMLAKLRTFKQWRADNPSGFDKIEAMMPNLRLLDDWWVLASVSVTDGPNLLRMMVKLRELDKLDMEEDGHKFYWCGDDPSAPPDDSCVCVVLMHPAFKSRMLETQEMDDSPPEPDYKLN